MMIHLPLHADLDEHEQKGLTDTKKLLVSPGERNQAIKGDKRAMDVDAKVESLAGNTENKEEIYGIAAEVMEKITQEANGDPAVMQKMLLDAQANPKAFYEKYFTDAAKARTRGVANKIEKAKPSMPPK